MAENHPNLALLMRVDPANITESADVFAEDAVWHYFNPRLPDLEGDYVGLAGLRDFFAKLAAATEGTFKVEPISVTPVGDELVVMHTRNTMTLPGEEVVTEVVVVWRIVDGRIAEVWDIPSVYGGGGDP